MTNATKMLNARSELVRLLTMSTGCALFLGLVGYFPTLILAGPDALASLIGGFAIALIGSVAGIVVPVFFLNRRIQDFANAALGGLGARFFVTLLFALLTSRVFPMQRSTLLLWVCIAQFVLLAVDTFGLIRIVKRQNAMREAL